MNKVLGDKKAVVAFVLPGFIIYSLLVILPVAWSAVYSFYDGTPGLNWEFSGLKNFVKLFHDKNFFNALTVNLKYIAVVMLGQVGLGLLLALLFCFGLRKFKTVIRTLVFFPVVLPTVAVGQLFQKIYEIQPNYGLLNSLLHAIGLERFTQPWLGQAFTALWGLCGMDIWVAMGFYSVIFYGALLDIPGDIIEAAKIDGCGFFQLFRHILAPLLRPMIIVCLVFSFTGTVKMFESALALTSGGPGSATRSLSMYMYDVAFSYNKVGYASLISIVIFLICVIGSALIRKFDKEY